MKQKEMFRVATDRIDVDAVWAMLRRTEWAGTRSREEVVRSIAASLCFSLVDHHGETVGFARVLTDETVYAVILDMVVRKDFRGRGLGTRLLRSICDDPRIAPLRKVLWTSRADGFYRKAGFETVPDLWFMARSWPRPKPAF